MSLSQRRVSIVNDCGTVLAAAASAYLAAVGLDLVRPSRALELVAVVSVGGVAIVSTVLLRRLRSAAERRLQMKDSHDHQKASAAPILRALPRTVHSFTVEHDETMDSSASVPFEELGASAWAVDGDRLRRLGRERYNFNPIESLIDWTQTKGVLGTCWRTAREQVVDTSALDARFRSISPAEWDRLPEDERLGLSASEYERIAGKYGTVIAVPVTSGGGVVGVVTLDAPPGYHAALDRPEVVEQVAAAAGLLQAVID